MQAALRLETTILPGHRLEVASSELPEGAKVDVIVVLPGTLTAQAASALGSGATLPPGPNQTMLSALARIAAIQKGMNPKDDNNTQQYLRDARSGEMYGDNPTE